MGHLQSKFAQAYDPKALHVIFIKDMDVYEEPVQSEYLSEDAPGILNNVGSARCVSCLVLVSWAFSVSYSSGKLLPFCSYNDWN